MNIKDFLEIAFIIAAGVAMPFIVIGSYFNLVSAGEERCKPLAILFLIISIIYALLYSYFSWKSIKKTDGWERIIEGKKTKEEGEK